MSEKTVRYTYENLPPLNEEGRARLKALEAMPAGKIDTSDMPVLSDEEWSSRKVLVGHFYRPTKQIVTARLDSDVLHWLRSQGKGYQSRMNAILRREMLHALKASASE